MSVEASFRPKHGNNLVDDGEWSGLPAAVQGYSSPTRASTTVPTAQSTGLPLMKTTRYPAGWSGCPTVMRSWIGARYRRNSHTGYR
jgi:hypothetical protein